MEQGENSINMIRDLFKSGSTEDRLSFIEKQNLKEDKRFQSFLREFIPIEKFSNNLWYNIVLIELAEKLQLWDKKLTDKYIKALNTNSHYLLKLSILDFFTAFILKKQKSDELIQTLKTLAFNKKERIIVRNQSILLLVLQDQLNYEKYINVLKKYSNQTLDYRCHIRTLNYIESYLLNRFLKNDLIDLTFLISKRVRGRAAAETLQKFVEKYDLRVK